MFKKSETAELNQKSNHLQIPVMWCIVASYFQAKSTVIAEKYINHVSLVPTYKKE